MKIEVGPDNMEDQGQREAIIGLGDFKRSSTVDLFGFKQVCNLFDCVCSLQRKMLLSNFYANNKLHTCLFCVLISLSIFLGCKNDGKDIESIWWQTN